jgi:hypothetical protein
MKKFTPPPPPAQGKEMLLYYRLSCDRINTMTELREVEHLQTQIPEKYEIIFYFGDLFRRI